MKNMIGTALLGAALLAPAALAAQEFEGMVRVRMSGGGTDQAVEITQYVKGTMIRQEMSMGGMEMVTLLNTEDGALTMLMPSQRMYMEIGGPGMRGMAGADRGGEPPALTATGRKETIAGHECEYYTMTTEDGQKIDLCVAKGLGWGWLGGGGGMGGRGMGMGGMAGAGGGGPQLDARWVKFWREHFSDGFFPLKLMGGTGDGNFVMEVLEVVRRAVSDDLMRVPEGYTGMNMGRRGGPPGGV